MSVKPLYILGISCFYHDAAAALVRDGQVVFAAAEERFTRKKHNLEFPINTIKFALKQEGIEAKDLDYIGFYEKPFIKFERILKTHLEYFPRSFKSFMVSIPLWLKKKLLVRQIIQRELDYRGEILFVDHHLCHAASAFLPSPFEAAAILTVDGTGEWSTTTLGQGKGSKITLFKEIRFPHSLGLLYSAVTAFLGFKVNDGEGKVMGLAPYGKPTFREQFKELVKVNEDGSFQLNLKYFAFPYSLKMFSPHFIKLFGKPRQFGEELEERHKDIAFCLQEVVEEIMLKLARTLYQRTKMKYLCIAGGVGLNSVANGRILNETPFEELFIQPAAGDDGTSLGVALYIYNCLLGYGRTYQMKTAYLGSIYSDQEIREMLEHRKIPYERLEEEELVRRTAEMLAQEKIIGWFQGRMEFGPRALGARSILTTPINPNMKDILNQRVKHREGFRPFAPTVLLEKSSEYFEIPTASPFMLLVGKVKPDKIAKVPAITHIDQTARVQTISKEENPLYYRLIEEFYRLTGVPVILNTSFNVRGEPIVESPFDAFSCFARTDMDYLVLGNYWIDKKKVPAEALKVPAIESFEEAHPGTLPKSAIPTG